MSWYRSLCFFHLFLLIILLPISAFANGVIIPTNYEGPSSIPLSIVSQDISIDINNQFAKTRVIQIFRNHTNSILEGTYLFPLSETSTISDFATWDDGQRIAGVILEKEEARETYERLVRRYIDPGLLEHMEKNMFKARISPIPAYGTKRLEIEYNQVLKLDSGQSSYIYPLSTEKESLQTIGELNIKITLTSNIAIDNIYIALYDADITRTDDNNIKIEYQAFKVAPEEDFSVYYSLSQKEEQRIGLIAYKPREGETGYFMLLLTPKVEREEGEEGKDIVFVYDISSSMRGKKHNQAWQAFKYGLNSLLSRDRFNIIAFNNYVNSFRDRFIEYSDISREVALQYVSSLEALGGSDLNRALVDGLQVIGEGEQNKFLILLSDGSPSAGEIDYAKIEENVKRAGAENVRIFAFGIGNDANDSLLNELTTASGGAVEYARETEDIGAKLKLFYDKLRQPILSNLTISWEGLRIKDFYPGKLADIYLGSQLIIVGRYEEPSRGEIVLRGKISGEDMIYQYSYELPGLETSNKFIARLWAKARVDHLLNLIQFEGEKPEWKEEIIELSKKYKFVTPYTSFLAVPRAILRPRVIKPGDPVLRIKAPINTKKITVLFPFGLVQPATYDPKSGLWLCRFLPPKDVKDGTYECTIIITDIYGNQVIEKKRYVIDSKPPTVRAWVKPEVAHPGERITIKATADRDTFQLIAKMPNGKKVELRYDMKSGYSIGYWTLPLDIEPGIYEIQLTAMDFAYNKGSQTVELRIIK